VIVTVALWSQATRAAGSVLDGIVQDGSGGRVRLAPIALAVVVGLESWAGHASALPRGSALAALASAAHLAAAGVWAGGLTVLALCLIPAMRRNPDARGPILATAWRTFSPLAAVATVVLMATGFYESGRHLPDLHSFVSTLYGRAVTGKLLLLALALTLAGFNTLLVNPRLAAPVGRMLRRPIGWAPVSLHRFTSVVVAEVVILILAVATAALLTSAPTAREVEMVATTTAPHNANVDGLFVTIEQVPAGADQTRLIVGARSTVKPEPAPISGIDVILVAPSGTTSGVPLSPVEPDRYEAEVARLTPGAWQASVAVHRGDLPDAVTQADWTVVATSPQKALPLEVVTTILAVLLLAGLAGVVRFARRHRERSMVSNPLVDERTGGRKA
jgi:copper transport protein